MATMTMEPETEITANETEIKQAMRVLGLDSWSDNVLDEIELNRRLKISLEQADKGMARPTKEVVNEILTELENGSFGR